MRRLLLRGGSELAYHLQHISQMMNDYFLAKAVIQKSTISQLKRLRLEYFCTDTLLLLPVA